MPYQYYTPTYLMPAGDDRLMQHFHYPVGRSVLLESDGTYRVVEVPSEDEMSAAVRVFQGGHVYLVTDEEAQDMIAAGFGEGLVALP